DFGAGALRRRDDLLRVGAWQLEAGMATNPDLLLGAARQAAGRFDHELAERLARAAVDAGGGPTAVRVLAEPLERQGRHAEAEAVSDEGRPAPRRRGRSWTGTRRPRAPSGPAGQAFAPGTSTGGWSGPPRPRRSCRRPLWPRRAARKRSPCWGGSCCLT